MISFFTQKEITAFCMLCVAMRHLLLLLRCLHTRLATLPICTTLRSSKSELVVLLCTTVSSAVLNQRWMLQLPDR